MKTKQLFAIALAMPMVAFLSCNKSDNKSDEPVNPSTEVVVISPASASVEEGKTVQLNAITNPEGLALVWSSDDPTKATVDQTGLVKGVAQGEALITAKTAKGTEASCQVSVTSAMSGGGKNIDDYVGLYDEVYGLILHEAAQAKFGETVKGMFNVDDYTVALDWWSGDQVCDMPSAEGANFFGQASGEGSYLRFATKADYAGYGWRMYDNVETEMQDDVEVPVSDEKRQARHEKLELYNTLVDRIKAEPEKYFLHIAVNSPKGERILMTFLNAGVSFIIGTPAEGEDAKYISDIPHTGQWFEYDIALNDFISTIQTKSTASSLEGPGSGLLFSGLNVYGDAAVFGLDAVYIYKKK